MIFDFIVIRPQIYVFFLKSPNFQSDFLTNGRKKASRPSQWGLAYNYNSLDSQTIKRVCKDNHISRYGQILTRKYRFFQFLLGD